MKCLKFFYTLLIFLVLPVGVYASDITGAWAAKFNTQIGEQSYTYDFKVEGAVLTGTITTPNGAATLTDGKVEGTTVSFTENLNYQGQALIITYKGEMVSDDVINFTRNVMGTDEPLTAMRVK